MTELLGLDKNEVVAARGGNIVLEPDPAQGEGSNRDRKSPKSEETKV